MRRIIDEMGTIQMRSLSSEADWNVIVICKCKLMSFYTTLYVPKLLPLDIQQEGRDVDGMQQVG